MSFSSLEIEPNFAKGIESDNIVGELSDEALIALSQIPAKEILKSDMKSHFRLNEKDYSSDAIDTELDNLVTRYEKDFKRALTYLQLHLYFQANVYTLNDLGVYKSTEYRKMYEAEKVKWSRFETSTRNYAQVINVVR